MNSIHRYMGAFVDTILYKKTNHPIVQFLRYGVTGTIAFLVDFVSLYVLTEYCSLHYLISAAIAFLLSAVVNYLLSISWVFNRSRKDKPMLVLSVFILIGLIGFGLTELLMWLFTDVVSLHYLLSKIVASALVALWNFVARRTFIQKKFN